MDQPLPTTPTSNTPVLSQATLEVPTTPVVPPTVIQPPTPVKSCSTCHQPVQESDFFCANCGAKLKEPAPSMTLMSQVILYAGSVFIPPMGIFWSRKYFRYPDSKARKIGMIAVALTLVSLLFTIVTTLQVVNSLNAQLNSQLDVYDLENY